MTHLHKLSTNSFGVQARKDVKRLLPASNSFQRKNVPGIGKVYFIKDAMGRDIGHVHRNIYLNDNRPKLQLTVK